MPASVGYLEYSRLVIDINVYHYAGLKPLNRVGMLYTLTRYATLYPIDKRYNPVAGFGEQTMYTS